MAPPVDAAEFDAHKEPTEIIVQFLCKNSDKGYSAQEIADVLGLAESDVSNCMVKLGFSDLVSKVTGRKLGARIQDATINGTIYYRCVTTSKK
ncbi:MAG: hypothetical protein ABI361_01255 [Nitrososphaera sp.]